MRFSSSFSASFLSFTLTAEAALASASGLSGVEGMKSVVPMLATMRPLVVEGDSITIAGDPGPRWPPGETGFGAGELVCELVP